ncbi:MAG: 6-phosphofructokinase, partial [Bacteroidales bacterium]|nr:6-phosphofructokinase [Bacteroidales bacterium]
MTDSSIRKIGVLTSGGDAPGMNAAIRAVVRTAMSEKISVVGIGHGYKGLINKEFTPMFGNSVSAIIHHGGTILRTSRCPEFRTDEGLDLAYQNMVDEDID